MAKKLDKLSQDIISLLEKHEPNMLRNNEICSSLWPSYEFHYKDKKGFGVRVSQILPRLVDEKRIKRDDIWYGTVKSKPKVALPNSNLRVLLDKNDVSERVIRKQLAKYPEIESLIEEYERKFGKIGDFREEILERGSDVVEMGYADNLSEEAVQQINEREALRRLIAEKIEDLIHP